MSVDINDSGDSSDLHRTPGFGSMLANDEHHRANYVPIRTLGRGAFGEAVLYRKAHDNSLVVWKEIELTRCSKRDKSRTMNEIEVLGMLRHHNIVQYFNHFHTDSFLLIEMEYANGGDLQGFIHSSTVLLEQKMVEWISFQLMSAISHVHSLSILHRDIKSLNIFLTKPAGLVKLGDFGISKMLITEEDAAKQQMAESVVGTPYYMSPELMQGKPYDYKSDMWACGCVLYELLTLTKTFEATNALRLASNVVHGVFNKEIDGEKYSKDLNNLLISLLQSDPQLRPDAESVLSGPVFQSKRVELDSQVERCANMFSPARSADSASMEPVVMSQTSEVYVWGGGRSLPSRVAHFQKQNSAVSVAVGSNCHAAITAERDLYTWTPGAGCRQLGQLGHGDLSSHRQPKKVASLEGMAVSQVCCGDEFTAILTGKGELFTCGSGDSFCLGDESLDEVLSPSLVPGLKDPVSMIACGVAHIVAVTQQHSVFTWGAGEFGRLGHGDETDQYSPQQLSLKGDPHIVSVAAGLDTTFMLCSDGQVLVCGNNQHNKLAATSPIPAKLAQKHKVNYDVPCVLQPKQAKLLRGYQVVSAACGNDHSAVIDVFGKLIMFGDNSRGQLGTGDIRTRSGLHVMSGEFSGRRVKLASCGDYFTVAATTDDHLYAWGWQEDGRLGISNLSSSKGSSTRSSVTRPRPVFGSLHQVAGLSSRHWYTLIIAEKVESSKTLTRSSGVDSRRSSIRSQESGGLSNSASRSTNLPDTVSETFSLDDSASSTGCPDWLKQELDGAEFIALDSDERPIKKEVQQSNKFGSGGAVQAATVDEVLLLKQHNQRLQDIVDEQQKLISELQSKIGSLEVDTNSK